MKEKLGKEVKGITLIALVITIIVLLILAGVSIAILTGNNGILTRANNAKATTEDKGAEEKVKLAVMAAKSQSTDGTLDADKLIAEIKNNYKGKGNRGDNGFPVTATVDGKQFTVDADGNVTLIGNSNDGNNTKKISDVTISYVDKNTKVEDEYGNIFMLPEGFKVRKDATTNNADTVDKGIVIEDKDGNQFVWIPVGTFKKDKNGTKEEVKLGRYEFASGGTASDYTGSYTEDTEKSHNSSSYKNAIAKNIDDFKSKVDSNHGYYIGRYEAGVENGILDTSAMTNRYTAPNKDWTGYKEQKGKKLKLVCKSGQQPWSYVTQNKASELARAMYTGKTYESDLMNSYAWDTAIVFIQKCSGDTDYSRQIRLQSTPAKTGEATDGTNKDVRCNIYDMAGNTMEWSTETASSSDYPCVRRAGDFSGSDYYTSSRRSFYTTGVYSDNSFRPILYL